MKLLLLTQYFPPEVGAPQNRLSELAIRLQKQNIEVKVLTAMPNYPSMEIHEDYRGRVFYKEKINGLDVSRAWIYVSRSGNMLSRLFNYFTFVFSSFFAGLFTTGKIDVLFCESPPLFLGITAWLLCKFKRAKMVFNVSDLWPESAEKLEIVTNSVLLFLAYKLESFLYRSSALVCGQTQGIIKNINHRFPEVKTFWLKNGVDTELFDPDMIKSDWRERHDFSEEDILFYYAGIMGHAQGLEIVLNAAEKIKERKNIHFLFFGSGPEEEKLKLLKEKINLNNAHFYPVQDKKDMPGIIKAMDVSIIPLKKLDLFKGAIPSKIFENLAMKKPILLGVDGEARQLFIEKGKCGLYFEPENVDALLLGIKKFIVEPGLMTELGSRGRDYVIKYFERDQIAADLRVNLEKL